MKPQCFKDNPNSKFKLIAVNYINYIYPHRYQVTFKDIETFDLYEEELLPEELRGYYIVGNIYSINGLEGESPYKIDSLHVPKSKVTHNNCFKIGDCIQLNNGYGLPIDHVFYNQTCFIYETKKYVYMIPSYVIANRYYFISTSIKKALSEGSFRSLYYEEKGYKFIDDTLHIETKKTLKDEQVPLIARMITNETSQKNFMFFYQTMTKYKQRYKNNKNIYEPVFLGFPFELNETFKLQCKILPIGHVYSSDKFRSFDLRKVIMITHIFGDKIPYNYKNLDQSVYKEDINDITQNFNENETKNIPRDNSKSTGKITGEASSDRYSKTKESFRVENTYDFSDINIQKKEIVQESTRTIFETTDEEVDESFDRSKQGSDRNKVREKLLDDDITKNSFQIEDFYVLIENFLETNNITEYLISELIDLENHDESSINKFFIDIKKEFPRKLIYGHFIFNNVLINFIEVEHNIYWEKNTWYFISKEIFSEVQVQSILNDYILKNQSTKQMLQDSKPLGALKFFMTRHNGLVINKEESKQQWCDNLKLGIKKRKL